MSRTAGSQDTGSTTIAIPAQGCVLDGKDKCPDDVFYNLDATHAISCADAKRCTVRSALAARSSWFCYPLYALLPAFSAPYGGSASSSLVTAAALRWHPLWRLALATRRHRQKSARRRAASRFQMHVASHCPTPGSY